MVCRQLLPTNLFGMVIVSMFSATQSMLSSDYNAVAAVITNDIYKRLFVPRASCDPSSSSGVWRRWGSG